MLVVAGCSTDVPTTSTAVCAIGQDEPSCSNEMQDTIDVVSAAETSNGKCDDVAAGGDGQSLQELESFLATLKAKQINKIIK